MENAMIISPRRLNPKPRLRRILSARSLATTVTASLVLAAGATSAHAHAAASAGSSTGAVSAWSFGEAFTFLFVTLGPLNVIGPFAAMTDGRDIAFRRGVALKALLVATIALVFAATVGAATLQAWRISTGALLLAGGAILFLVALRPVLAGYDPRPTQMQASAVPAGSEFELAFSPLAFPTIVSPYGLALLILLLSVSPISSGGLWIIGAAALVLALDLLVMLGADLIAKIPFIKPGLDILGGVMNVLLVALGVQAVADGLRLIAPLKF
jgi:multiple antibiotic resistance protein